MIEQTSFMGIPLRTQRGRRLLVVSYYALLLAIVSFALWQGGHSWGSLSGLTFAMGSLLGGLRQGGPVKAYGKVPHPEGVQTLNLAGRRSFESSEPLDERERGRRDHAHFIAYRILYVTLAFAALAYIVCLANVPQLTQRATPPLLWSFFVYVLSLPQSVLLWTEPDEPAGELSPVPHPAQ
jgi:hypothetical protein